MEQAQQQDGDESLAAWIKRIIRKELQQRGIEPRADMTCPGIRYNRQLVRSVCLPSHFPFRHRAANSDGV